MLVIVVGMGSFLDATAHLEDACRRFLDERYGVSLAEDELRRLVAEGQAAVEGEMPGADLDAKNRRLLVWVRSRVLPFSGPPAGGTGAGAAAGFPAFRNAAPQAAAPPAATPAPPTEPLEDMARVPPPSENTRMEEEETFIKRLQEIEQQRNMPMVAPPPVAAAAAPAAVPAPAEGRTVVYVPAPARRGLPIVIHGMDRDGSKDPVRAQFAWNGPIPAFVNAADTRVACARLPSGIEDETPMVWVQIQSANGKSAECVLVPEAGAGAAAARWTTWRPPADALAQLPLLAVPWTIRFLNVHRELISMGRDMWRVAQASVPEHAPVYTRIVVEGGAPVASVGERIRLLRTGGSGGGMRRGTVVACSPDGTLDISCSCAPWVQAGIAAGGVALLNESRQACIVLDTSLSAHRT